MALEAPLCRKLHIIAGRPSTSKSTITLGWVAQITTGKDWIDGSPCDGGRVVIWSGEDAADDTIVPRLIAAGADLSMVKIVTTTTESKGAKRPFSPATDMAALNAAMRDLDDVAMLILDPVVSVVGAKQDSHKNSEVRGALQPVVDLAEQLDIAVLGVSHFTKGTAGGDPIERVTGSLAFGAVPRIVFATVAEAGKLKSFRWVIAKSNIGPEGGGAEYAVEVHQIKVGDVEVETTTVKWGTVLAGNARKLIEEVEGTGNGAGRPNDKMQAAITLINRKMIDGKPVLVGDLQAAADLAGVSWDTMKKARRGSGIVSEKVDPTNPRSLSHWRRLADGEQPTNPISPAFSNVEAAA